MLKHELQQRQCWRKSIAVIPTIKTKISSQASWFTPVIPALGMLREEDQFKVSLGDIVRTCSKTNKQNLTSAS
jgi:hypothetical protein